MNPKQIAQYLLVAVVVGVVFLWVPSTLFAQKGHANSWIFPPDSQPFGMTYGDWSAAWWQYEFSLATSTNPILNPAADCNVKQSSGPVFFVGASFGVPATLTCTLPASKALFFPLLSTECSTPEPPPYHGSDPQELRTCAGAFADAICINTLKLTVDGVDIHHLERFRAQSPLFDFITPATDNILGLPGVTSGSSVEDGYLVMLKPLSPGSHVIRFGGAFVSGPASGFSADTTVYLTVQ
jgi:hypothetical protein